MQDILFPLISNTPIADAVEPIIREVAESCDLQNTSMSVPTLLVDMQPEGQRLVGRQGWHTDLKEGQQGFVAIGTTQETSMLFYPESQRVVEEFWRLDGMVRDEEIPESDLTTWMQMRIFKALRLRMSVGCLVFLSGHTVHAGDRGVDGKPSYGVHWYVSDVGNEEEHATNHLLQYGEKFAAAFH